MIKITPEADSVLRKFLMKFFEKISRLNLSVSLFIIIIQTLYITYVNFHKTIIANKKNAGNL